MKKGMLFMVLVALMVVPMISYAANKEKCESQCLQLCSGKGDEDHAVCMKLCMNQCMRDKHTDNRDLKEPSQSDRNSFKPCIEADTIKESVTKNIVLAADNGLPCYAGGKYVGNCSHAKPYYNVFSGECYPSLQDCKKADGDLSKTQGSGGCVRCSK
jgi:hypothetical protein